MSPPSSPAVCNLEEDLSTGEIVAAMNDVAGPPKHQDLIYDIGMHKGEDTEFYLRKGFRVVAFEANPELVGFCKARFREFIEYGRLTIIEGAILESNTLLPGQKTVQFYVSKLNSVWGTVCEEWAQRNERMGDSSTPVEVDVIDMAAVLEEYGVPRYMKIDIEGCDMACVSALRKFSVRPDYVSLESEKTGFNSIQQQIDALAELGYDAFQAVEQSKIHRCQVPPLPPKEGKYVTHQFEEGCSGLFGAELPGGWKSRREILSHFRIVSLGYRLLGDDSVMSRWRFPLARMIRSLTRSFLKFITGSAVPGWHDTHARHASAAASRT
ncbi:MAG TPA: FkbM family methyltransferase [Pirellulales bacterium]|jgi:FkbM family methyltransferase